MKQVLLTSRWRWYGMVLLVVIVAAIIGCGGNGTSKAIAASGFKQVGATYVGTLECRNCHANIADEYKTSVMGDATSSMSSAKCNSCHTTGWGQPTGYTLDASDAQKQVMDGIGCEDCHGPGSKHVAAGTNEERVENITKVPPAKDACWGCHGGRKAADPVTGVTLVGAIFDPAAPVTAATLHDLAPSKVGGPHHAAADFLLGRNGYGLEEPMPSPHASLDNTCIACHTPKDNPLTGDALHGLGALTPNLDTSQPECASCHSGRDETLVQRGVVEAMIELAGEGSTPGTPDRNAAGGLLGAYVAAHNINVSSNNAPDDPYVIAYKAARYDYNVVHGEGSDGVHNPGFAQKLLQDAKDALAANP